MKAAILETGAPPAALIPRFGRYPDMFRALLGAEWVGPSYDVAQELPEPTAHPAWLLTGSPAGVYEDEGWIARLLDFLRAVPPETKLVGICFGHQAMAQAFGGRVAKSERGWGVGLHRYEVVRREPWMEPFARSVAIPVSHQDQVVERPPEAEAIVRNAFCPYAGLAWRDRAAISFQFHPEFSPDFAAALYGARRDRLPDPDGAIASLEGRNDNQCVGEWIRRFLAC